MRRITLAIEPLGVVLTLNRLLLGLVLTLSVLAPALPTLANHEDAGSYWQQQQDQSRESDNQRARDQQRANEQAADRYRDSQSTSQMYDPAKSFNPNRSAPISYRRENRHVLIWGRALESFPGSTLRCLS